VTGPEETVALLVDGATVRCVHDMHGRLVGLFRDPWSMDHIIQKYPTLKFDTVAAED
jgi:hypothetical protein